MLAEIPKPPDGSDDIATITSLAEKLKVGVYLVEKKKGSWVVAINSWKREHLDLLHEEYPTATIEPGIMILDGESC